MVAHPLPAHSLRLAPLGLPRVDVRSHAARRLGWWSLIVAGLACAAYILVGSMSAAAWWAFNSGPLTGDPEVVLTEPSPFGAVRTYGDTPQLPPEDSARQTVSALERAGGFARSTLVVALPTGSGWVDPKEIAALEQEAGGDIATVAMRYSRAPSGAVYTLRPEVAEDSAHALLTEIAEHLRAMDAASRPQLIVHGQSLGAQAGEAALADTSLLDMVSAVVWQGLPGAETAHPANAAPLGDCALSAVNGDDPVTKLSWALLKDPAEAVSVLTHLPGSESKPPGTAHSYRPVLPPEHCVAPPAAVAPQPSHASAFPATAAVNRVR